MSIDGRAFLIRSRSGTRVPIGRSNHTDTTRARAALT